MTTKPKTWDLKPGEERITEIRAATRDPNWILYEFTDCTGRPFIQIARFAEVARDRRNAWLESNVMTIPKPEPESVPASECCDDRCRCDHGYPGCQCAELTPDPLGE